jgi:hypothetical protein
VLYLLAARNVPDGWRRFAGNVLLPLYALVGAIVSMQYVTVGELRYYAIKTADLLEMVSIIAAAVVLGSVLYRRKIVAIHRWLALPIGLGLGAILLVGMTTSPFDQARIIFGNLTHAGRASADTSRYVRLGTSRQLHMNSVDLHYNATTNKLSGNALLTNWAHLMQYTPDNTAEADQCNSRIFALQTNTAGTDQGDEQLIAAVKDCITAAQARHLPYFIVTDAACIKIICLANAILRVWLKLSRPPRPTNSW